MPDHPTRLALVVHPERQVRALLRAALEQRGYEVVEADHPHDAIVAFHAAAGIGAVVTDLRLPELDGRTLVAHLRRQRPMLPVLLLADHSSEVRDLTAPGDGGMTVVALKPLTPRRVAEALGALLPE